MMKVTSTIRSLVIIVLVCLFHPLLAQDNLRVQFEGANAPDFLNICGDPDSEIVRVRLNGNPGGTLENVQATAHLFFGVELVAFDPVNSTAGVTLVSNADPNNPVFSLPDLSSSGQNFALISFSVAAKCSYVDTLTANDMAVVVDEWEFDYTLGVQNLNESHLNTEYRDAFAVPQFTISADTTIGATRVGDCLERDILINNSGLDGFVDTLIYENVQGNGIYVSSIQVNGIPLAITKIPTIDGDTIITGVIDGAFFQNNTSGNGAGNGDVFMDPDETVTVTESFCVLDCDDDRTSMHTASWGCDNRFCTEVAVPDFIEIGEGAANVRILNAGSVANEFTGYCTPGVSVLSFINDGVEVDPGFAGMMNVAVGAGLGNSFALTEGPYDITGITVAGVEITGALTLNFLDNNPAFATDPDGPGGLSDLDGDGFFDDLAQNDTLEIIAYYEFDCSRGAEPGDDGTCANEFSVSFNARIDYDNQCNDRIVRVANRYANSTNSRSTVENFTEPDAFVEEDTFVLVHTETRGVFNFDKDCDGNEVWQIKMVLPTGITHVPTFTNLYRNEATLPIPLLSETMSNDTLTIHFDASTTPFIGGEFRVEIGLTGDCSASLGETYFPTTFSFVCPSCDCEHQWWCGDLEGPNLHANIPPCPPNTFECPQGVQTTAFEINRTTFGYTDNNYTTKFNPDLANKKVGISCDSVEMRLMNIVGDTPISDSIGVVITYDNVDGSASTDQTFLFGEGTLRITNAGNEHFCNITPANTIHTTEDSTQTLTFDLNQCLVDLGITLVAMDTIEFIGNFAINPEGPFENEFLQVPNLRAYAFANINDEEFACDNFGDNFTLAKSFTVMNAPSSSSMPEGCEETYLNYQLITVNNGFADYFGNEFRQAVGIDSIRFVFDPEVLNGFSVFEPEVSIPGHPIHGNNYFPVPGFETVSGNTYVAHFDTLTAVPALNVVQSYSFNFRIRVIPDCKSPNASSNNNNVYDFDPTLYFKDRFYASVIGDGSCVDPIEDTKDNDIFYSDPPTFTLNPVTAPVYEAFGDTAVWEFQYCNTSFTADAAISWIALEQADTNLQVVSIQDVSDPLSPVALTISQYGLNNENAYAFSPGLLRANGTNSLDEICNTYRVKAVIKSCGTSNLNAMAGWNCAPYSDPLWNPQDYPPCSDVELPLSAIALDPFLDANIITQPSTGFDICDDNEISIILRNTQRGNVYDVTTQLIIPMEGMELVPGSFEVAYPSNAPFIPTVGEPTLVGTETRGQIFQFDDFSQIHPYLDQNGLKGFDPLVPDSNEVVIRYRFTTNCDFMSGSLSYYSFQGLKGCQDTTNFETGETLPLNVNGAEPPGNKNFDIEFTPESALVPGETSTIEVIVVNRATDPTVATDVITLTLPEGVGYESNSTTTILPTGWNTNTEPQVDVDGNITSLDWVMPAGVPTNDTIRYTFEVTAPDIDCAVSNFDVNLFTVHRSTLFCASLGVNCEIDDITSSNNGSTTSLPVLQNLLAIEIGDFNSSCDASNQEEMTISGALNNLGSDINATNVTIRYFYDNDNDGTVSTGDTEVSSHTESGPILSGATLPINHVFSVDASQACGLIAQLDTTGLDLCQPSEIPLGDPQLNNAGDDQLFCAVAPLTINTELGDDVCLGMTGYIYNWRAIAPATVGFLSATDIPNPEVTIPHNASAEDTLSFILETTRPVCGGVSVDTVNIIRGLGLVLSAPDTVYVLPGGSTTIGVIAENGTEPYSYEWSPTVSLDDPTIANPTATPTGDTDYTVTVTSSSGCTEVVTIAVINDNAIHGGIIPDDVTVCPNEQIGLLGYGGTDYEWQDDPTNPPGGSLSDYTIADPYFIGTESNSVYRFIAIISDSSFPGFVDTAEVTITTLESPDIQILKSPITTECANVTVTLEATGADSYTWEVLPSGLVAGTGNIIEVNPVVPTTYMAYGPNAQGCIDTAIIDVDVFTPPIVITPINDFETCASDTNMVVISINEDIQSFEITGTGDFQNAVVTDSTLTFEAIYVNDPSEFDVTIQGANSGCQTTESFTIAACGCQPPTLTSVAIIEPTCGNEDGWATILLEGDESNYNYVWTPDLGTANAVGNARTGLPAGGYSVVISEVGDPSCSEVVEIVLTNSDGPTAIATTTPATCAASNGTATLTPANFNYQWQGSLGTGATQNSLTAGTYFVTVTHPAFPDCPGIIQVEIEEENDLAADVVVDIQPDCHFANGQVTVNATGGSGTYNYSFASGTNTQSGLAAGTHVVTITDASGSGCSIEVPFVLTNNVPAGTVTINNENSISCEGQNDGRVDFTVVYDPAFNAPADTIITDGDNVYENGNLPPGDYCIVIQDEGGCVAGGGCFTVEEPESIDLHFNVTPDCGTPGSIDLTINNGTEPFTVDWADLPGVSNMEDRTGLANGDYQLTVTDANGCTLEEILTLPAEACPCEAPTVDAIIVVESQCGQSSGSARIEMTGDNGQYAYDWTPSIGTPNDIGNERTGLPFGGYTVMVSDTTDNSCVTEVLILITNLDGLEVTATTTPATCAAANGGVSLSPDNFNYSWIDGSTAFNRNDLTAGTYFVTVTDPADPSCPNIIQIEITEDNPLQATAQVDNNPLCGLSDGTVTINVTGGSGDYTYIWSDGMMTTDAQRSGLASGSFTVTVRDNDVTIACETIVAFVLTDLVPGATLTIDAVNGVTCFGANNGAVEFSIVYDGAFNGTPDTVITDGVNIFENGNLPAGEYCVMIMDGAGCTAGSGCFTIDEPEQLTLVATVTPVCEDLGEINVEMMGGTAPYDYGWSDLNGTGDPADRTGLGVGTYAITVMDAMGCVVSDDSVIVPNCPDNECDYFFGEETISLTHDCGETSLVCMDLELNDLNNYLITINGNIYTDNFEGCNWDTLVTYGYNNLFGQGNSGPYTMTSWIVGDSTYTGDFADIDGLVNLMNGLVPSAGFTADTSALVISGLGNNLGFGAMEIEATDFGATSTLTAALTGNPLGLGVRLDTGYYEIIVQDTFSLCTDTLLANITCEQVFRGDICFNETLTWCLDTMDYQGRGISGFRNVCTGLSGENVEFVVNSSTYCVGYTSITVGVDTACIEICDLAGICDTVSLIINAANCTNDGPNIFCDTIFVGQDEVYCMDSLSLPGNLVSIDNFCEGEGTGNADIFLNPETFCVEYSGLEVGRDTACIIYCDDTGLCDTTYFCVQVEPYFDPPIAVDDTAYTFTGTPVVIDIKANDILYGGVDTIYLISQPNYGTATLNLDCSVTYNPEDETCERWDSFQYEVCTPNGCDIATVYVFIECTDIVIFTAVSPNADGQNDEFFIAGIEDFPEAELQIFNRWGNKVFETRNYKNDWKGTYKDKDLPDGTYFYFLQLNDEGGRSFKGYLELYR